MTDIATIDFHGDRLFVFEQDSKPFVAMRPIVEALGLDWSAQYRRIMRDDVLGGSVAMMATVTGAGEREAVCLPLDLLNGWLFGVDAARVRPELREKITLYRRECFAALASHFNPLATAEPQVWTAPTAEEMLTLQERRQLVNEARVTFCRRSAQELWIQLGLPTTPTMLDRGRPAAPVGDPRDKILSLIRASPNITRRDICQKMQKLKAAEVDRIVVSLKAEGLIRVGEERPRYGGRPTIRYAAVQ